MSYSLVVFDLAGTLVHPQTLMLYPGMLDILQNLRDQGVDIGVATNFGRETQRDVFIKNDLQPYITVYKNASIAALKPDVEMLESLMLETGSDPENTIMIGDTTSDIDMANALRVTSCAMHWHGELPLEVASSLPTFSASSAKELKRILEL